MLGFTQKPERLRGKGKCEVKSFKQVLLLCRAPKLNESLRLLWRSTGYDAHIVNSVPDAHLWWDRNILKMPEDFQVVLVTLNGRGRNYWYIFLNSIEERYLPPVEIDL